jgi:hypothetical protein
VNQSELGSVPGLEAVAIRLGPGDVELRVFAVEDDGLAEYAVGDRVA